MSDRTLDQQIADGVADGRLSAGDAEHVHTFASFLIATKGIPVKAADRTPEQQRAFMAAYAEFYPDDYSKLIAEGIRRKEAGS